MSVWIFIISICFLFQCVQLVLRDAKRAFIDFGQKSATRILASGGRFFIRRLGQNFWRPSRFAKQPLGFSSGCLAEIGLAAESEALDDLLVAFFRAFLDVIKEFAALGNQGKESTAGREVLFVNVQMVGQMEDPSGEERHLVWCASGVSFVELIGFEVDFFSAHGNKGWIQRVPDRPRFKVGRGEKLTDAKFAR